VTLVQEGINMVKPLILNGQFGPKVFINLSANVGPQSPNKPDDVQFVQLGYLSMSQSPLLRGRLSQAEREAFGKIKPGAFYSGASDDPLTVAIRAHEAGRGGTQDGHVSVATGSTYDGTHSFIIVPLNNAIRDMMVRDFPRVDKHPQCPAALKVSTMLMMLGGVG
jgi:hypothetical protein